MQRRSWSADTDAIMINKYIKPCLFSVWKKRTFVTLEKHAVVMTLTVLASFLRHKFDQVKNSQVYKVLLKIMFSVLINNIILTICSLCKAPPWRLKRALRRWDCCLWAWCTWSSVTSETHSGITQRVSIMLLSHTTGNLSV